MAAACKGSRAHIPVSLVAGIVGGRTNNLADRPAPSATPRKAESAIVAQEERYRQAKAAAAATLLKPEIKNGLRVVDDNTSLSDIPCIQAQAVLVLHLQELSLANVGTSESITTEPPAIFSLAET